MKKDKKDPNADKRLRAAVLVFRTRLGLTQTQFGALLGKGVATIQRWELLVAPKGNALAKLIRLADLKKQPDLSELFRLAMSAELGMDVHLAPMTFGYNVDADHQVIADAFFEMLDSPEKWANVRESVERDLGPIIAELARRVDDDDDGPLIPINKRRRQ